MKDPDNLDTMAIEAYNAVILIFLWIQLIYKERPTTEISIGDI
jgi:hypothetical protein